MIINKFIIYKDRCDFDKNICSIDTVDINEEILIMNKEGFEVVNITHSTKEVHKDGMMCILNIYKVLYKKEMEIIGVRIDGIKRSV